MSYSSPALLSFNSLFHLRLFASASLACLSFYVKFLIKLDNAAQLTVERHFSISYIAREQNIPLAISYIFEYVCLLHLHNLTTFI